LYSIIMIVSAGLVGFALLLGGRKFARPLHSSKPASRVNRDMASS
ncbi:hypothetical protein ISX56_27635, partial [Serratia ureilytica]|nr:hypothetical protein [Serratia ureilytica]